MVTGHSRVKFRTDWTAITLSTTNYKRHCSIFEILQLRKLVKVNTGRTQHSSHLKTEDNIPEWTGTDEALEHVTPVRGSPDACQAGASLEEQASLHHFQETLHGHPTAVQRIQ